MQRRLYRLSFESGLHLSEGKNGTYDRSQPTLHSDTLKSALFVAALQLYGEKANNAENGIDIDFLESFNISSAFPWMEYRGSILYFLPKPIGLFDDYELPSCLRPDEEKLLKKKLKGIKFLETSLLKKVLKEGVKPLLSENLFIVEGNAFLSVDEDKRGDFEQKFASEIQQHVAIPRQVDRSRLTDEEKENWPVDSTPYTVDKIYFRKNAGLYILAEAEKFIQLEAALALLSDSGLGTDKNNGAGTFTFVKTGLPLMLSKSSGKGKVQMNLSLYCPKPIEVSESSILRYQLVKRGGYIANPASNEHLSIRKRSIYMFSEGSLFVFDESRIGQIANLRPADKPLIDSGVARISHPIYRDGRSIFLSLDLTDNSI